MKKPSALFARLAVASAIAISAALSVANTAQAVSTSISQNATGFLWLGNQLNPPPNQNMAITNTVTVTAAGNAGTPTGSVTAALYLWASENICGQTPVFQVASQPLVNGAATFSVGVEQLGGGYYVWLVQYTSSQPAQYANSVSDCGATTSFISKASPELSIQPSRFFPTLGSAVDLKATLAGAYKPSATVTFYSSGPNDPSCSQRTVLATLAMSNDRTATYSFSATQPGTYVLSASFNGDNLNQGASTGCSNDGKVTFIPSGPQPASSFRVTGPPNVYAGQPFDFTVTALDAYSNVATGYNGTVHFASRGAGVMPANSVLTNGSATFQATLNTLGGRTITATDTNVSTITGASSIYVYPQSSYVVTNPNDSDDGVCNSNCTLREAINATNSLPGPNTITFNIPNRSGCTAANQCTVMLDTPLPALDDDVAIDGSVNNANITIDGNRRHSLSVNGGKRVKLTALKFERAAVFQPNYSDPIGGAIFNGGTLYLSGITFYDNLAFDLGGGAIANTGTLDVTDCYFSANASANGGPGGGAIYNLGTLTISRTTFDNNVAYGKGGGTIYHSAGSLT
ncbi:MAG TPA: Ig-like domain repeat protein, partial [Chthoniobacterales bacterium]